MKFLYKIFSGYDGFTPRRIPDRIDEDGRLSLGWARYIDEVESGAKCWIYFHGPHQFRNGVYAKGTVTSVLQEERRILLKVTEYSTEHPITDAPTTARVADVVSSRNRQVFLWPEVWDHAPECSAAACEARLCDRCETWQSFPLVSERSYHDPDRLCGDYEKFVPAFWIIPKRSYVIQKRRPLKRSVYTVTNLFGNFKLGGKAYGYTFAYGIFVALQRQELSNFDEIVPIPLSPDKAKAGELNRTRLLANELSRLNGVPVRQRLKLQRPISKRIMRARHLTAAQYEEQYYDALQVAGRSGGQRILLIDDVATHGSTLSQAIRRLKAADPESAIVVATAGPMIVRASVADEADFIR
jgi:predicted amidophosphoribosyltransferase